MLLLWLHRRPDDSFLWFTSPLKTFKHIIWKRYKWHIILGILLVLAALLIVILVYTVPVSTCSTSFGMLLLLCWAALHSICYHISLILTVDNNILISFYYFICILSITSFFLLHSLSFPPSSSLSPFHYLAIECADTSCNRGHSAYLKSYSLINLHFLS